MKKLLITGFVPFGEHSSNLSQDIALELNNELINGYKVTSKILPVSYTKVPQMIRSLIDTEKPDVIIMLGIAQNRVKITPELIAINQIHSDLSDNENVLIQKSYIKEDEPNAFFSTLPVYEMVNTLNQKKLTSELSTTAGTYVCNQVFYEAMHYLNIRQSNICAGFIHLPTCLQKNTILEAIKVCISCI